MVNYFLNKTNKSKKNKSLEEAGIKVTLDLVIIQIDQE